MSIREWEVTFKPIMVNAETKEEALQKAIREVDLGNLEEDTIELW